MLGWTTRPTPSGFCGLLTSAGRRDSRIERPSRRRALAIASALLRGCIPRDGGTSQWRPVPKHQKEATVRPQIEAQALSRHECPGQFRYADRIRKFLARCHSDSRVADRSRRGLQLVMKRTLALNTRWPIEMRRRPTPSSSPLAQCSLLLNVQSRCARS